MTLRDLATLMGVDATISDPQQIVDAMAMKWNEYANKMKQAMMKKAQAPPVGPPAGPPAGPPGAPPVAAAVASPFPPAQQPRAPWPVAASHALAELRAENRQHKLEGLLHAGKISSATFERLAEEFCDRDRLVLSLSHSGEIEDNFDSVVEALSLAAPTLPRGSRSGPQVLPLSRKSGKPSESPLQRAAERLADQHKQVS